jgi:hypothetical protein
MPGTAENSVRRKKKITKFFITNLAADNLILLAP